jgi:hypothetical protein
MNSLCLDLRIDVWEFIFGYEIERWRIERTTVSELRESDIGVSERFGSDLE